MKFVSSSEISNAKFVKTLNFDEFDAEFELPNGSEPDQNASLTIIIKYSLNFADAKNYGQGKIFEHFGTSVAKDAANQPFAVKEWTSERRAGLQKRFDGVEAAWNEKFTLITPKDFDGFDYITKSEPAWICRPNVICRFKLKSGSQSHLPLDVVLPENAASVANRVDNMLPTTTLWREIAQTLEQNSIILLPDKKTLIDIATPEQSGNFVMPPAPTLERGKSWQEVIARITKTPLSRWTIAIPPSPPARKMPVGFVVRGVMPTIW